MAQIKYSNQFIADLKTKLSDYIESHDLPILAEFSYKNNVYQQLLSDLAERELKSLPLNEDNEHLIEENKSYVTLSDLIKKAIEKKQTYLEKQGLQNKVNNAMAIFSLKQLGWRDDNQPHVKQQDSVTISATGKTADQLMEMLKHRLQGQKTDNRKRLKSK